MGSLSRSFTYLELESVIITYPTDLSSLPYPNSTQRMKLHYRHRYNNDWKSVTSIEGLKLTDDSELNSDRESTGLHPSKDKDLMDITVSVQEREDIASRNNANKAPTDMMMKTKTTTTALTQAIASLPEIHAQLLVTIDVGGTRIRKECLTLDITTSESGKVKLTGIHDDETSQALSKVLESLPEYLRKKVFR